MNSFLKYIIPALLLSALFSFRQQDDTPIEGRAGIAYYHFSHVRDTMRPSRIWEEDFQLAFGPQQSVYLSATKRRQDSAHRAAFEEAERTNSATVNMGVWRPVTEESVYNNGQALLVNRSFRQANYLIKEPLEKTDWQITTETKQILGHTCQKATGTVKGRTYTAWFTTDIPASFGPWKLYGLPGLILEAHDNANRIRFTCTRIETDAALPSGVSLEPPADATSTTNTAFLRMEAAYREGLSANAGSTDDIRVETATVNGQQMNAPNNKPRFNYPLELPLTK
ncbi:GLPGLI family protein [Chitinophaga caseinilytica]|uniref:GLPGLI family protein n=1 Tax=Chitinophaga caseinilytica TaxID=2267521 RepID=A0ABZ2Z7R3_9BACT